MITVDRLTKRFGTFTALDRVTFSIRRGEVYALLGPNGSGKTTTLRSIVGLCVPTEGDIRVDGLDVRVHQRRARSLVSFLPQRVVFPESLTARELIRFYGSMRNISKSLADEYLEQEKFNGASDKPVGEFSGGMIQRLGLAIVAMPDAPILLLDEPTANLDPQGVKRFREFVLQQKALGKTVVFSTHLLAEVEQLADRAGIFVAGKLVAQETIDDLRASSRVSGTIEDLYLHYVEKHQS